MAVRPLKCITKSQMNHPLSNTLSLLSHKLTCYFYSNTIKEPCDVRNTYFRSNTDVHKDWKNVAWTWEGSSKNCVKNKMQMWIIVTSKDIHSVTENQV